MPNHVAALEKEANALKGSGAFAAAAEKFERIIAGGHADAYIWSQLGDTYSGMEAYAQSVAAYTAALAQDPENPGLHVNISRPRYMLGEADVAAYHLEFALLRMNARTALENLAAIAPGVPSFSMEKILEVRRALGLAMASPEKHPASCLNDVRSGAATGAAGVPPRTLGKPGEPLRVAYLSAHFGRPAYMGPVWALVNHHDRARVKIFLLSDADVASDFADYIPREEDTIVDISTASDAQLTAFIKAQGIDILVDLSGYSYRPRLTLFARRAAPVVATWFNMYATSGLPGIDYIIGDNHVVRPGEEQFYSEKVLRLPQSYLTFMPWENRPPVGLSPCAGGAPFTFGSLVSLYKITEPVVDAWCAMLTQAPASRLLIANADLKSTHNREHFIARFESRGIDPARLILRDPAPHDRFLRYYEEIDLALDSFPYSGGTTTMEALWQGVPVLTHNGAGWPARTTGTLLAGTHLADFCCRDVGEYIERGTAWAVDPVSPARLAALRYAMREKLRESSSLDGAALARHMESLYANM